MLAAFVLYEGVRNVSKSGESWRNGGQDDLALVGYTASERELY
jgi:hypothetical protein